MKTESSVKKTLQDWRDNGSYWSEYEESAPLKPETIDYAEQFLEQCLQVDGTYPDQLFLESSNNITCIWQTERTFYFEIEIQADGLFSYIFETGQGLKGYDDVPIDKIPLQHIFLTLAQFRRIEHGVFQ